jgi:hypothetical protein
VVVLILFAGRDYDYQTLNLTCVVNVVRFGFLVSLFLKPFKLCIVSSIRVFMPLSVFSCHRTHFSIVSCMLSNLPSQIQQEIEYIRPMVEEWFARMEEYGEDWDDKPVCQTIVMSLMSHHIVNSQNDMLMWLISETQGMNMPIEGLAWRLLLANLAGLYSMSSVSGNILFVCMVQS